jgi:hypothetical protein
LVMCKLDIYNLCILIPIKFGKHSNKQLCSSDRTMQNLIGLHPKSALPLKCILAKSTHKCV